jgi:hypothetical protein
MGVAKDFIDNNEVLLNRIKKYIFNSILSGGRKYSASFSYYGHLVSISVPSVDVLVVVEHRGKVVIGIDSRKCDYHYFHGTATEVPANKKLMPLFVTGEPLGYKMNRIIPYIQIDPAVGEARRYNFIVPYRGKPAKFFFGSPSFPIHNLLEYGSSEGEFNSLCRCLYVMMSEVKVTEDVK